MEKEHIHANGNMHGWRIRGLWNASSSSICMSDF